MGLEKKLLLIEEKAATVVALLYQNRKAEGYTKLNELSGLLLDYIQVVSLEPLSEEQNENLIQPVKQLLQDVLQVMEVGEAVFLADILQNSLLGMPEIEENSIVYGDYLEQNLQMLERYDKDTYNNYVKWMDEHHENYIVSEVAGDGSWILGIEKENGIRWLNSRYYPAKEAIVWSEQFVLNSINQVVTLFGLGNGMFAQQLKKRAHKEAKLIIYEPSIEIFDFWMHNARVCDVFGQKNTILLVKGLNEKKLYGILDTLLDWDNEKNTLVTVHSQYEVLYREEYEAFHHAVTEGVIRARQRKATTIHYRKDIISNMLEALLYIKDTQYIEQYIGQFGEGVPAIIIAAGPSLDLNIDKLKLAKNKAVLIAVDTAVRDLIKHDIMPDFIVVVDPRKPAEYLANSECQYIPLLCSDTANREILRNHKGVKIFDSDYDFMKKMRPSWIPLSKRSGKGGCVATAAFEFCIRLKFKTVIMVGQDLAYRNGVSHAGGRMSGEAEHGSWLIDVEDIYGNTVTTRHEWYSFLRWFEDAISTAAKDMDIIDATEGGALIHGTRIMRLEEAINECCNDMIDCERIVSSIPFAYRGVDYEEAIAYVEQAVRDTEKIYMETKELMLSTERLISLCRRRQYDKEYKKLVSDLTRLGDKVMNYPIYEWVDLWIEDGEEELSDIYSLEAGSEEKSYVAALKLYGDIHEAAKEIKPLLQNTLDGMKQEEL